MQKSNFKSIPIAVGTRWQRRHGISGVFLERMDCFIPEGTLVSLQAFVTFLKGFEGNNTSTTAPCKGLAFSFSFVVVISLKCRQTESGVWFEPASFIGWSNIVVGTGTKKNNCDRQKFRFHQIRSQGSSANSLSFTSVTKSLRPAGTRCLSINQYLT